MRRFLESFERREAIALPRGPGLFPLRVAEVEAKSHALAHPAAR